MNESRSQDAQRDRISGWKEIAQYLRRSVRSVQRWEHELGLPIQRVHTLKGQVIFASRVELDEWMVQHEHRSEEPLEPVEPVEPLEPVQLPARRFRWWHGAGLGAAALALVAVSWLPPLRSDLASKTVKLSGTSLEGRNATGQVVWTHEFEQPARRLDLWALGGDGATDSVADLDLSGDGVMRHLVPLRFGTSAKPVVSDALFAFDGNGKVIWSLQPDQVVTCGGQSFEGPWQLSDVVVSSAPGPRRTWVAFRHHTWWPSFVIEVTPAGAPSLRYVQAGWVMSLALWQMSRGPALVAGGVLNEHERASVVFLDLDGPPALSPAADPRFRCVVQDSVGPRQMTLFPPQEVTKVQGHAYPIVYRVNASARDLLVEVDSSRSLVTFGPDGQASSQGMSDDYWLAHKALSASNTLDHGVESCPELLQPREMREWTSAGGWRTYLVGSR